MRQLISYSAKCCTDVASVPKYFFCFLPQLQRDYCKLKKRYESVVTKNPRILRLAQPSNPIKRFYPLCKCDNSVLSKVNIICPETPRTRTEQLAYPVVHKLLELKNGESFKSFSTAQKDTINRTLRKSLLSVYSRLANTKMPERKVKQPPMSEKEKMQHNRYLRKLSTPKRPVKASEGSKSKKFSKKMYGRMNANTPNMERLKLLSRPRTYPNLMALPWQLSDSLRNYKPTPRLLKLSQNPTNKFTKYSFTNSRLGVSERILSNEGYQRLGALAKPTKIYTRDSTDTNRNAFKISPNALKAIATPRITQLAEPKNFIDSHTRPHPFRVSPRALKAVLTPRLKELAHPKNRA